MVQQLRAFISDLQYLAQQLSAFLGVDSSGIVEMTPVISGAPGYPGRVHNGVKV